MNRVLAAFTALLILVSGGFFAGARVIAEGGPTVVAQPSAPDPLPGLPPGAHRMVALSGDLPGMLQARTPVSEFLTPAIEVRDTESGQEQLRDWLLLSLVVNAGFDAAEVAASTYEAPKLRSTYAHVIGQFQYGPMRWAALKDRSMVVLLAQEQNEAQRADDTAAAADAYVVRYGVRPTSVHVVVYCLTGVGGDNSNVALEIQRSATLAQADVFSPAFGWIEEKVSEGGLEGFLARSDDLVGLQTGESGIVATGRKYRNRSYGHLTTEHIATLWQGQEEIRRYSSIISRQYDELVQELVTSEVARLVAQNATLKRDWERYRRIVATGHAPTIEELELVRAFRSELDELTESTHEEVKAVQRVRHDCTAVIHIAELSLKSAPSAEEKAVLDLWNRVASFENAGSPHEQSLRRGGLGFSLDPRYLRTELEDYLRRIFSGDTVEFSLRLRLQLAVNTDTDQREAVFAVADRLSDRIVDYLRPFEKPILASISTDDDLDLLSCLINNAVSDQGERTLLARSIRGALLEHVSYQTARYDGGIEGTEAGLILFYTDLMAKLYGADFLNVAADTYGSTVPQWIPTVYDVDPAYFQEAKELPGTRIWFGLRSDAVSAGSGGAISFVRTAARVFALSNTGTGEKREVQASYQQEAWVNYFNEHYDRIAASEARFDQLNQLTKWSIALDKLSNEISGSGLDNILAQRTVRRDLWFPTWLAATNGGAPLPAWANCFREPVRPKGWAVETTQIYHAGWPSAPDFWCEGTPPESLWLGSPISEIWGPRAWSVQGGVSLPSADSISNRLSRGAFEAGSALPPAWRPQAVAEGFSERMSGATTKFVPENGYSRTFTFETKESGRRSTVTARAVAETVEGSASTDILVRGQAAQVRSSELVETISTLNQTADVSVTDGRAVLGHIEIVAGDRAFGIVANPGARRVADGIALSLSRLEPADWARSLTANLHVDSAMRIGDRYFARLTSRDWFEFSLESKTNRWSEQAWQTRSSNDFDGAFEGAPKVVMSRSIDPAELQEAARSYEWLEFIRVPRDDGTFAIQIRGPPNGPPPPTDSVGLAFGPPEDPKRGRFGSGGSAYFDTEKPIPFDPLVTAFKAFNERLVQEAKVGDVLTLAAVEAAPQPSPEALALLGHLQAAVDNHEGYSLRIALESVKKIRKEINAAVAHSLASGDSTTASGLQDAMVSTLRPTQAETLESVRLSFIKKGLSTDENLLSTGLTPSNYGEEMLARAVAAASRGPEALAENVQQAHLAFAQATQVMNNTGLVAVKGTSAPRVALEVGAAYRPVRATEEHVRRAKLRYVSEDLSQANLADPLVLASVMRDAYLIEIVDPEGLIARGIQNALPDELVLGGGIRVNLVHSDVVKPSFVESENWQPAYLNFAKHIGRSYACAGVADIADSACLGAGGGGSDGGGAGGGGSGGEGGSPASRQITAADPSSILILVSAEVACGACQTCLFPMADGRASSASVVP